MKPIESTEVKVNTDYVEIYLVVVQIYYRRNIYIYIYIYMLSIPVVMFGIVAVSVALLVSIIGGTLTQVSIC